MLFKIFTMFNLFMSSFSQENVCPSDIDEDGLVNVGDLLKVKGPAQLKNNLDVDEDPVIKGTSFDPITVKN